VLWLSAATTDGTSTMVMVVEWGDCRDKILNQESALKRYGKCCFPYTMANKVTGFLLFLAVPMIFVSIIPIAKAVSVATFVAIHEGHFIRTSR
jgi:hypothetical protein